MKARTWGIVFMVAATMVLVWLMLGKYTRNGPPYPAAHSSDSVAALLAPPHPRSRP